MASVNKKHKAKNSYIHNGNEAQKIHKWKRVAYFIKADRLNGRASVRKEQIEAV